MRFDIGQVILLVGVNFSLTKFDNKRGDRGFTFRIPQPDDTINEIKFVESTVKEHHKVPGEWDNEPKYDGFIFDVQGHRGTNQYPRAVYGQITDAQDRVISIADELYEKKYNNNFEQYKAGEEIVYFTTAANMFDTLKNGIKFFTKLDQPLMAEKLQGQLEQFTKAMAEQFPQYKMTETEIIKDSGIYHVEVNKA